MLEEFKSISSTKKDLINFTQVMTIAFAILGGLMFLRHKENCGLFLIISGVFLLFRIFWPQGIMPLQKIWMGFSIITGAIMSRIVLSILFFVGFTIIGIIGRIFGKDFLNLKIDKNANSYWIKTPNIKFDAKRYEKQF